MTWSTLIFFLKKKPRPPSLLLYNRFHCHPFAGKHIQVYGAGKKKRRRLVGQMMTNWISAGHREIENSGRNWADWINTHKVRETLSLCSFLAVIVWWESRLFFGCHLRIIVDRRLACLAWRGQVRSFGLSLRCLMIYFPFFFFFNARKLCNRDWETGASAMIISVTHNVQAVRLFRSPI